MLQSDNKQKHVTHECDLSHIGCLRRADMLDASDAEAARFSGSPRGSRDFRGLTSIPASGAESDPPKCL